MISGTAVAQQKKIAIEKYQMENICHNAYNNYEVLRFNRYYKFTFHSHDSVFENYSRLNDYNNMVHLETNLYKLNYINPLLNINSSTWNIPKIITNKKTIEIVLDEDDMKKLYQSKYLTLVFNKDLFATEYVDWVIRGMYERVRPIPVISIFLNKRKFDNELAECNKIHNIYMKEYNEYQSKPINRLKSFFGF